MVKGIFITIDGPNGAGKSSFIKELSNKISQTSPVYLTREPSPTQFGDFVRTNEQHLRGLPYAHLIWSDRHFHIQNFVLPELNGGKIVISDRYIESSLVLQSFDGVHIEDVWALNQDFIIPDVSVMLYADPEILADRLSQRNFLTNFEERMTREQEVAAYKTAVDFLSRRGYRHLVCKNNTIEDLERNVEEVYNKICSMMG